MPIDDRGREIDQFAVADTRSLAQHIERSALVNRVAFHQDSLGAFDRGATSERPLEIVVLGEPSQHDVNRALPILDVVVRDVSEHAPLGGFLDEPRIWGVQQDNHRASGFMHDLVDQVERVLGALAQADQRNVGSLPGGDRADVRYINLSSDHLMAKRDHDRRDERETVTPLVRDQHTKVAGLAVTGPGQKIIKRLDAALSVTQPLIQRSR